MPVSDNLIIENAKIILRNFSGIEKKYNPAGTRNFGVLLEEETAAKLAQEGWHIKTLAPKDPDGVPALFLPVTVKFGQYPPKIVKMTSHNKVLLNEKSVGSLDTDEITKVDLIVRPYNWIAKGETGVKAYLKTMYVTIAEDVFESKYYVPEDEEPPFI